MKHLNSVRFLIFGLIFLLLGTAVSCATAEETAEPATDDTAAEVEVPEEVTIVQESALEHLRTIAQVCVPPEGTPWHAETNDDFADTGTSIYLFSAENCVLNVSYPSPATDDTLFYVALRNATLDFCWQAVVDAKGDILSTEYEPVEPGLINPAAVYCQEQGYTFEIRTREDGKQCGACVFSEAAEDVCNAWDYFYGTCGPSE
jgi:putative hemolysin